jgi:stage II sporulation protein GA (sporulation sigma-E factor processing peptidase)
VDTGNLLRDPLSGLPVIVVSAKAAAGLVPKDCRPQISELRSPEEGFALLAREWSPARVQLLPFHAVGTRNGLLLAIRLDRLEVGGKEYHNRLAALTPETFPDGYQAIIGAEEGGSL